MDCSVQAPMGGTNSSPKSWIVTASEMQAALDLRHGSTAMTIIAIIVHIAELALLAIILWHVVSAQWPMSAPMTRTSQGLIVLIVVLVALSMILGQPVPVALGNAPTLIR
jgi:hypothetical protein